MTCSTRSASARVTTSVEAAVAQLRRAGFADVRAASGLLEHAFDPEGYVSFVTEFDEEDLINSLEPEERDSVTRRLRERLERMSADDLVLRLPVVSVSGVRT